MSRLSEIETKYGEMLTGKWSGGAVMQDDMVYLIKRVKALSEVVEEVAYHLYEDQDYSRVRSQARALLEER